MKKFLKVFAIVLIVLLSGIAALFYFIDPNQYKGYLVQQIEQKTGYKLLINGDLNWHILPKLSVLANNVVIIAPGASTPIVSTENMQLDVELIPLFSKKLQVEQVILNTAQVKLTDDTLPNRLFAQKKNNNEPIKDSEKRSDKTIILSYKNKDHLRYGETLKQLLTQFQISKFQISNSQLVLQQTENKDNLLTVKNVDLLLERKSHFIFNLQNRANIDINKQHVFIDWSADIDMQSLPEHITIIFNKVDYKLNMADVAINGSMVANVKYGLDNQQAHVTLDQLNYKVILPDMTLTGMTNVSANYDNIAKKANVALLKVSYFLEGNHFARSGVEGYLQLAANYDIEKQALQITPIKLEANKNTITGIANISLSDIPTIKLTLTSDLINLENILANETKKATIETKKISNPKNNTEANIKNTSDNALAFLRSIKTDINLTITSLRVNGVTANDIMVNVSNDRGKAQIKTLSASLFNGKVSLPGTINAIGKQPYITLSPKIENINWEILANVFHLPQLLAGSFSMNGNLSGYGLDKQAILDNWMGKVALTFNNAKLHNLNIERIIDKAASINGLADKFDKRYEKYTEFNQLNASATLQSSVLALDPLQIDSKALNIIGVGSVALNNMMCDFNLNIKLLQKISNSNKTQHVFDALKKATIPMHIYGDCSNLNYKISINNLLKEQAKAEAKEHATKVIDKYLDNEKVDGIKQKAMDKILGILNKRK